VITSDTIDCRTKINTIGARMRGTEKETRLARILLAALQHLKW